MSITNLSTQNLSAPPIPLPLSEMTHRTGRAGERERERERDRERDRRKRQSVVAPKLININK